MSVAQLVQVCLSPFHGPLVLHVWFFIAAVMSYGKTISKVCAKLLQKSEMLCAPWLRTVVSPAPHLGNTWLQV